MIVSLTEFSNHCHQATRASFVMNYNMQGMDKTIPELFAMLKAAEVEIKKEHKVLIVNKTTSFKKKGKGKKGTSRRTASKLLLK